MKGKITRNLEWANKRLKLQGKGLDETQLTNLTIAGMLMKDTPFIMDLEEIKQNKNGNKRKNKRTYQ